MRSGLQVAALIVLLLMVTFALGIEFGGSGLSGASGGFGASTGLSKQTKQTVQTGQYSLSEFVVKAQGVNPQDLYASSSFRNIPSDMLVPLVGLHVTLLSQERSSLLTRRIPTFSLATNASGIASAFLLSGDYDVELVGSTFSLGTAVTLIENTTLTLSVQLQPSGEPVADLRVVSSDTMSGVETGSRLYALVENTTAPAPGFSELIGFQRGSSTLVMETNAGILYYVNATGPLISLNSTLQGSYLGSGGYWATLYPTGPYPVYPTMGVMLFQFKLLTEVNYTAS